MKSALSEELSQFVQSLGAAGWKIIVRQQPMPQLNVDFRLRYPTIPVDYAEFLSNVAFCANKDETAWFLCEDDFNRIGSSAFRWDEFEAQSLEAAGSDEQWRSQIRDFWNWHLPIALSLKSDYAFLCMALSEDDYGAIAYGYEPEYESVQKLCDNFSELLNLLVAVLEGKITPSPLSDFI
jgi:hypothetical protein